MGLSRWKKDIWRAFSRFFFCFTNSANRDVSDIFASATSCLAEVPRLGGGGGGGGGVLRRPRDDRPVWVGDRERGERERRLSGKGRSAGYKVEGRWRVKIT